MKDWYHHLIYRRVTRHILFWTAWVLGFTFIKSFGMPLSIYAGWFVYYIVTLPIFVLHTYLIVYWLIPAYFRMKKYLLFSVFFIILFFIFSVIELVVSHEFIFKYFETGTRIIENYLSPGNIIISGLGNFYIILVFLAVRSINTWYLNQEQQKNLVRQNLEHRVDHVISRVQPRLLIYAVNHIERLAEKSPELATRAIALTSEILNEVMIYNGQPYQVIEKEVDLIRKLAGLVEIFRGNRPEIEFFLSGDPSRIQFPSLILFTFVEMIFRKFDHTVIPEINIEISGFSNMATIQVLLDNHSRKEQGIQECEELLRHFERLYPELIRIAFDHTEYGCSIVISCIRQPEKADRSQVNIRV